jgi:hypothetical protein
MHAATSSRFSAALAAALLLAFSLAPNGAAAQSRRGFGGPGWGWGGWGSPYRGGFHSRYHGGGGYGGFSFGPETLGPPTEPLPALPPTPAAGEFAALGFTGPVHGYSDDPAQYYHQNAIYLRAGPDAASPGDRCRDYYAERTLAGEPRFVQGTACPRARGWWQIMSQEPLDLAAAQAMTASK